MSERTWRDTYTLTSHLEEKIRMLGESARMAAYLRHAPIYNSSIRNEFRPRLAHDVYVVRTACGIYVAPALKSWVDRFFEVGFVPADKDPTLPSSWSQERIKGRDLMDDDELLDLLDGISSRESNSEIDKANMELQNRVSFLCDYLEKSDEPFQVIERTMGIQVPTEMRKEWEHACWLGVAVPGDLALLAIEKDLSAFEETLYRYQELARAQRFTLFRESQSLTFWYHNKRASFASTLQSISVGIDDDELRQVFIAYANDMRIPPNQIQELAFAAQQGRDLNSELASFFDQLEAHNAWADDSFVPERRPAYELTSEARR